MRLLGAPAIPAPGLHPFLGIGTVGLGGRCRSLQQNAEQAAPFGHDPKADAGFQKIGSSKALLRFAKLFAHGSRRRFEANWKAGGVEAAASPRAGGLMCDVKE